jgi:Pretoxin HINT domain
VDYCFAPETPLRSPLGHKRAGEFKPDDEILSAPDGDASLPVGVKRVEKVFVGFARVVNLTVSGKVIRLTAAHRIFVWGKRFIPAGTAQPGDLVRSDNNRTVAVEAVTDSGEEVAVVNLRVAGSRTYFVGATEWGFSVWAHNDSKVWVNNLERLNAAFKDSDQLNAAYN